jgi:hypothetical protein
LLSRPWCGERRRVLTFLHEVAVNPLSNLTSEVFVVVRPETLRNEQGVGELVDTCGRSLTELGLFSRRQAEAKIHTEFVKERPNVHIATLTEVSARRQQVSRTSSNN